MIANIFKKLKIILSIVFDVIIMRTNQWIKQSEHEKMINSKIRKQTILFNKISD